MWVKACLLQGQHPGRCTQNTHWGLLGQIECIGGAGRMQGGGKGATARACELVFVYQRLFRVLIEVDVEELNWS